MSDLSVEIWERSGGLGRWAVRWLPGVIAGIATGAVAADRGGYFPTTWGWAAVPLCWVAVMALFVRDHISLSRLELTFLGVLLAIPGWYAVSVLWSSNVPQTILEVERALVYPSAVLAIVLVTRRSSTRHLLTGILVAITAVCWYAIAKRLFPTSTPSYDVISTYRLTRPITYWNALGIYSAVGALVALGLATTGRSTLARALSAATLVILVPTMYLTFSRGAWIAMALGLLAAIAIAPKRLTVLTGILALAPAPAITVLVASRSTALTRLQSSLTKAQTDGHRMALAMLVLGIASAGIAVVLAQAERRLRPSRSFRRAYRGAIAVVVAAVLAIAFVHFGNPVTMARHGWSSFTGPPVQVGSGTNLNSRLFSLSSNGRIDIWSQALDAYTAHPLGGIGGGSFERWWNVHRTSDLKVVDAHSLYIEVLAELGPIGLLLMLAAVGLPLAAGIRNRHDPLVPLVFGAFLAFAFHAGIDWDWEVSGVTLGGLLVGTSLLTRSRGDNPRVRGSGFRWPALALVLVVGLFSLFALVGNRFVARTGGTSAAVALDNADRADGWAPWSAVGLARLGDHQRLEGLTTSARISYRKAIARDPNDYLLWLNLALASKGKARVAAAKHALALNPLAPEINALRPYLGLPPLPGAAAGTAGAAATTTAAATATAAATTTAPAATTAPAVTTAAAATTAAATDTGVATATTAAAADTAVATSTGP